MALIMDGGFDEQGSSRLLAARVRIMFMFSLEKSTSRIYALDIARALAVMGVVFNHTVDGLVGSNLVADTSAIAEFNRSLYIFRMPALAFMLGLFMPRGVEKRGTRGYIKEKVTFAFYIYFVWFVIQMLVEISTSSLKNTPRSWDSLFTVWNMPAHLWFMPFLAVAAVVVSVAAPWRNVPRKFMTISVLTGLCLLVWGWNPSFFGLRGLSLLLFTALGAVVGARRLGTFLSRNPVSWMFFGIVALCGFVILLTIGVSPGTMENINALGYFESGRSIIAAVLGVFVLLSVAALLSYIPTLRDGLQAIGAKTLEIYLAHVMVVAGVRILLERLGVHSELTLVSSALLFGVGAPLLLAVLAPRVGLAWLFQVPGSLGRWSCSSNSQVVPTGSQTAPQDKA